MMLPRMFNSVQCTRTWYTIALLAVTSGFVVASNSMEDTASDKRTVAQQGPAVEVVCDKDVAWVEEAQVFSGNGTVWHDTWEPICRNGLPNLELLGMNGYEVGSFIGDIQELMAMDGRDALEEWLGECRRNNIMVTFVPAQVEIKPMHQHVCWDETTKAVYLGDDTTTRTTPWDQGNECAKCLIAVTNDKYPCSDDQLIFCDTDDYDYSVFSPKYDNSCSARARREWLVMGEKVASLLHKEECEELRAHGRD